MSKWIERSNSIEHNELILEYVSFVPAIDIDCSPPYKKGVRDGCWIKYNPKIWMPNFNTKQDCERLIGISILALSG